MKKALLSTLRVICAGAMSLYAVSCYDDSALREDLAGLEGEVAGLAARLDSLENKLNAEVKTLGGLIDGLEATVALQDEEFAAAVADLTAKLDALDGKLDGYITSNDDAIAAAIAEFQKANEALAAADADLLAKLVAVGVNNVAKNEAGNVVITFVTGETLEIPTTPQEGLVTVVTDEAGVKYWAVVTDGEPVSLDVPVGHPGLEFKVEDNMLYFSVDGTTWNETGAVVSDSEWYFFSDFYQGSEWDDDLWEEVADDYYTLVFGGEEYYLPLYKVDNSVVTIKAGKTYFAYGESKTIDVAVVDVTSMYVMTKPDGWKAKLDGNKLTVTAPSEANIASEVAEAEGEVLLHCTTKDGGCKIAKLAVSTTEGFSLTVNADGTFTLVNPYATVQVDEMWGDVYGEFNESVIGLATISSFEKDPVAYVNAIVNGEDHRDDIAFYVSNWKMNTMDWETGEFAIGGNYVYGKYEVDIINSSVADVYNFYTYGELPRGSQYVVWAAPVSATDGSPLTDELVFGYYTPMDVNMEVAGEASFNEIPVSLTLYGADKFYVGHVAKEYCFNWNTEQYDLKEYLSMYIGYLKYGVNQIGMEFEAGVHEAVLSELVHEMEEAAPLTPDTEYFGFILPIISGKAAADYSFDDVFSFDFKTAGLTEGGSIEVEFENESETYTQLSAEIVADGAAMGYYKWYTTDEYNALEDVVADLLTGESYMFAGDFALANQTVNPGDAYVLAALAVDEDGQYGEASAVTLTAPTLTYSETFVATAGEPVFVANGSNWKVTVPVTVEGGEAAKYYYYWNTSVRTEEQLAKLPLGSKAYYYYYDSTTAPKDLVFYSYYASYQYAVVVESTTGELSKPVIITVDKPASVETENGGTN